MKKLKLLFYFYQKAFLSCFISSLILIGNINFSLLFFATLSIIPYAIYYEYFKQKYYLFYFNNSITKLNLYLFCVIVNTMLSIIIKIILVYA